jgi:hypothetical protein
VIVILRTCEFFESTKNQCCKQYSYGDKMLEKSKKVTNSERSEELMHFVCTTSAFQGSDNGLRSLCYEINL